MCTAKTNVAFSFCWQCLEEWKGPSPYPDRCANECCISKAQEILNTCHDITFKDVKGVSGCPSVRACPTCGLLVEHNKNRCKYIGCLRCKVKFCFVCLKRYEECLDEDRLSFYFCCASGVAPRQTTITLQISVMLRGSVDPDPAGATLPVTHHGCREDTHSRREAER
ncbi:hypothetical protein F7725_004613 [Dissostichus mawsoni]|uniref:RBR-type E3 ubiquitin transferase n=1 Tax=Dissostichus mawsoni TaxID=36200 RepID=A0A7J5XKP1_DISMA|nr:hypothetical protein F7725_004613 [Dissostichus mawsoni]